MADRYRDRPFPADNDYDRGGDPQASARGESDPLAELARLIGQTDPFGTTGRTNQQVPPRTNARDPYQQRPAEPVYQRPAEPSYRASGRAGRQPSCGPAAVDAARQQAGASAAGTAAGLPGARYTRCSVMPRRVPRPNPSIRRSRNTPTSRSPIHRVMTTRCTDSSMPAHSLSRVTRPMRMTPTPIGTATTTAPKSPSRSGAAGWSP